MTTIDYKSAALAELDRMNRMDRDAKNAAVWREALLKYSFASHQANFSLVRDWCNGELTMAKIDHLLRNMPDGFQLDWTDEKPKLVNAILAARQWPNPTNERKRLAYKTRVQLLDELATMIKKEEYAKFTAVELKAGLADYRAREVASSFYFDTKGGRWPRLASVIVPPGFVSAISTSEYLRHAAKNGAATLRQFVGKYGLEQVDRYLNS